MAAVGAFVMAMSPSLDNRSSGRHAIARGLFDARDEGMVMAKNFFTGTDAELYTGTLNFSTKISAGATGYGLTVALAGQYATLSSNFRTAYQLAINPDTRTKGTVAAKNTAKKALKIMAADFARIIDATPSVTDQQKIDLGINVRKAPAPIPAPTARPGMELVSVFGRTVTVRIYDSASKSKRGKAKGAASAFVYSFVGETYPTDPTLWQFDGPSTKAKHEIVFPNSVSGGQQVWICAAWVNARGEAGPTNVPITTNVQGGGVGASGNMKIAA